MGKMDTVLIICLALLILGGCSPDPVSSESKAPPPSNNEKSLHAVDYSSVGVIQQVADKILLVGDTYYEFTPASTFADSTGSILKPDDLLPGDLVALTASRKTEENFPQHGILLSLVRHGDEKSLLISRAINHVLLHQETGDIKSLEIKSASSQLVTLQFHSLSDERKYECIVNMKSLDFHIKEIPFPLSKQNP